MAASHTARTLAAGAELAHQALCQHTQERRAEQERLYAHIAQTGDGAERIIGVQGGQHQVAGERGLNSDLRGFFVADFANHDDVGVLPQDGPERFGKVEVNFRVDLGLANAA